MIKKILSILLCLALLSASFFSLSAAALIIEEETNTQESNNTAFVTAEVEKVIVEKGNTDYELGTITIEEVYAGALQAGESSSGNVKTLDLNFGYSYQFLPELQYSGWMHFRKITLDNIEVLAGDIVIKEVKEQANAIKIVIETASTEASKIVLSGIQFYTDDAPCGSFYLTINGLAVDSVNHGAGVAVELSKSAPDMPRVTLTAGSNEAIVGEASVVMDNKPYINERGTCMIPLRAVVNLLDSEGSTISWVQETQKAVVMNSYKCVVFQSGFAYDFTHSFIASFLFRIADLPLKKGIKK